MPVDDGEPLARFAVNKAYFRANGTVKHNAFMPYQGGTSVFRVAELSDEEVWELGDEHVAAVRGKDVIARANVLVSDVLEINLSVDPDDTPPRHANIAGWADSKSEIRQQALELAAKATLTRK